MVNYKTFDFLEPSGCLSEIMTQPYNNQKVIEVAVFQDHRNSFYYWTKWTRELQKKEINEIPSLITFDWHQDLCFPVEDEKSELEKLDVDNLSEIAFFSWGRLSHLNDCQIGAAVHLNFVKDVYVICRQKHLNDNGFDYKDYQGNTHNVKIFHSIDEFIYYFPQIKDDRLYYDIDLDFFTIENGYSNEKGKYTYMNRNEIKKYFSLDNQLIKDIFNRLEGFTIATEPEFCGGLKKSNYLLNTIDNLYFEPSLFYKGGSEKYTKWKITNE